MREHFQKTNNKIPSLYLWFGLLYIVLSSVYFIVKNYFGFGNLSYVFYSASFSELRDWYPRHYFIIQILIFTLRTSTFAAVIVGGITCYKKRKTIAKSNWLSYNKNQQYIPFIKYEAILALKILLFYLTLYFLSKYLSHRSFYNEIQLFISKGFLIHLLFQLSIITIAHLEQIIEYLKSYLLKPTLPYNIAIFRILFFTYSIYIYGLIFNKSLPTISLPTKATLPYIGWLINLIPVTPSLYQMFYTIGIICCLFIIIGFKTRLFLIINSICIFYVVATPNFFGKLSHEQIVIWISWFFTLSRCYDTLSLDAYLKKEPIQRSADYTFPIRFIWITLGIIYFWAGFYKLWDSGLDWALSGSMINQVQLEWLQNYDKVPAFRIDYFPIILQIGGLLAIVFELCYLFLILYPKYRWIAATGGLLMHNIVGYFMYISFFHLLQVFYLFYIDFNKWFKTKITTIKKGYSKPAFMIGVVIISCNFLCGMLSIDSYPFSAYPKYSALIPSSLKIIYFEIRDEPTIDVHQIGANNDFRWESYGWVESGIIDDIEKEKDVSSKIENYWATWTNHNPELKKHKNVDIYIIERPVAPAGKKHIKFIRKVGSLESNTLSSHQKEVQTSFKPYIH